jgi:hypothetical protein
MIILSSLSHSAHLGHLAEIYIYIYRRERERKRERERGRERETEIEIEREREKEKENEDWGFQSGSGPSLRSRLFLNLVDCAGWARCVCVWRRDC